MSIAKWCKAETFAMNVDSGLEFYYAETVKKHKGVRKYK